MQIRALNNGYYQYKGEDGLLFKARLKKCLHEDMKTKADTLVVDDEKYIVGIGNYNIDLDKTESKEDFTKICVLNALSRYMDKDNLSKETFKLVLSAPPLVFLEQRNLLSAYLRGRYEIVHNSKFKSITIDDIAVFPETFTAYLPHAQEYQDKQLLIIDIGGYTTTVAKIVENNFSDDDYITIPSGMYNIDKKISQYITSEHKIPCTIDDMFFYRKNGLYLDGEDINILELEKDVIDEIYSEHIKEIINQCKIMEWNIRSYSVLCVGGGSIVLFDVIKSNIKQAKLSKTALYDNLLGLEMLKEVFEQ